MKVLFGSIIVDARGRLNGHVLKKTAFGNSMSALAMPRSAQLWKMNSALQRNVAIMRSWNFLTPLARSQWEEFANLNPLPNKFGVLRNISGRAMMVRCTQKYAFPAIGVVPVDVASNQNPPTEIVPLGVDGVSGKISWETSLLNETFQIVIYVQQVGNGNNVPLNNKWRRINNEVINSLGIKEGAGNVFSVCGAPRLNHRYFVKFQVINSTGWGTAEVVMPLAVD